MTGRLASRAADAGAVLTRFNEASEHALAALARGDGDAFAQALDVREALRQEIERVLREIAVTRSRFAPDNDGRSSSRVVDRAMDRYCAPLEDLARAAHALQQRLEQSAVEARERLINEIATLDNAASVAARYAALAPGAHQVDRRL
jgi:hypothetical protein